MNFWYLSFAGVLRVQVTAIVGLHSRLDTALLNSTRHMPVYQLMSLADKVFLDAAKQRGVLSYLEGPISPTCLGTCFHPPLRTHNAAQNH